MVPDPRSSHGRCHPFAALEGRPLPAIPALAAAAMLCGARSLYAIAQWGRVQEPGVVQALRFTREQTPAVSTLHEVFSRLDVEAFEGALMVWSEENLGVGKEAIAIDGKGLRGIHGEELPGVRLIATYAHRAGLVPAQKGGQGQQEEVGVEGGHTPAVRD